MNTLQFARDLRPGVAAVALVFALLVGCSKQPGKEQHVSFETPAAAASAFVAALEKGDVATLRAQLGPGSEDLLSSGDEVQDAADRAGFVTAYKAKNSLIDDGAGRRTLVVGENDWPMPIPLVERDGRWYLDGAEGADELVYRRVGANELGAIDVCRGFVEAQMEYAAEGRDGDPPGIFALKLMSDPGLHNGLYWETEEGEPESPAGAFVAAAAGEGYRRTEGERSPYHGYYYRMLYSQGPNANGGAREYFRDGVLTAGFALVAWPADYGASGVQTFIVNQDGVVFQKDLGEDTATLVESIQVFDPDSSWTAVVPPAEETAPPVT
jgi:hypothetical protein